MTKKGLLSKIAIAFVGVCALVLGGLGLDFTPAHAAVSGAGTSENPYVVSTVEDLQAAIDSTENETNYIKVGGTMTLSQNVVQQQENNPFVLDLNGKILDFGTSGGYFLLKKGATLKNGMISGTSSSQLLYLADGGEYALSGLRVENGGSTAVSVYASTLTMTDCTITGADNALYLTNATATAENFTFTTTAADGEAAYLYQSTLTLDGAAHTATIEKASYHTHKDENGDEKCDREHEYMFTGSGTEADPYVVINVQQLVYAADCEPLSGTVNHIKLANDMSGEAKIEVEVMDAPVVIDLNGKTLTMDNPENAAFEFYNDATLKNGKIVGAYVYVSMSGKTVNLEDLTIENNRAVVLSAHVGNTNISKCTLITTAPEGDTILIGNGIIVGNNVTLSAGNLTWKMASNTATGSLTLDGGSTMSYDAYGNYYHTHKDLDGDCVCDWGQEPAHKYGQGYTYQDNGDGTHDELYACCGGVSIDNAQHVFDQEVADEKYMKSNWNCLSGRIYYKSCKCGAAGEETFVGGTPAPLIHASEKTHFVDKGDGTHDKVRDCCQSVVWNVYHTYDQEIVAEGYKASEVSCTAAATYYKSCVCGAKGEETFVNGTADGSAHTGTATKLVDNEDGTHDVTYTCCNAVAQDDVACSATDGDDTCLTAEHCACGHEIKAAKTAHAYGDNGTCNDCSAQKPADSSTSEEGSATDSASSGNEEEEKKGCNGCKGEVGVSVLPMLALALAGAFLLRKRKE